MSNLKEHPDVQDLIDTLDKNGLEKEKAETEKARLEDLKEKLTALGTGINEGIEN